MLYTLPLISALIGWFTNYIAVKMLFHPRKEVNLILFKIQGIFPKRQKELAEKLGELVARELFSIEDIKKEMSGVTIDGDTHKLLDEHVDNFLRNKLTQEMPMLAMFMNDEVVDKIKNTLITEMETFMPKVVDAFANKMESMDIKAIVSEKVRNFSSDKLEEILYSIMKKEFWFIEIIGGVLGFMIGLIQVLIVVITM